MRKVRCSFIKRPYNQQYANYYFKLKGTDTPIFFIGLKNNMGEISWYDIEKKDYSCFSFNMDDFIESTKNEFTELLNINEGRNSKILGRIKEIEDNYEKCHPINL